MCPTWALSHTPRLSLRQGIHMFKERKRVCVCVCDGVVVARQTHVTCQDVGSNFPLVSRSRHHHAASGHNSYGPQLKDTLRDEHSFL